MFLVTFIYAYSIGIDYSLKRFNHISDDYETRERYALKTYEIYEDYKLTGIGIGNFQYLYPRNQSFEDKKQYFLYAHNDWLQFAAEAGIAGFVLLIAGISFYIFFTIRLWKARNYSERQKKVAMMMSIIGGQSRLKSPLAPLLKRGVGGILEQLR